MTRRQSGVVHLWRAAVFGLVFVPTFLPGCSTTSSSRSGVGTPSQTMAEPTAAPPWAAPEQLCEKIESNCIASPKVRGQLGGDEGVTCPDGLRNCGYFAGCGKTWACVNRYDRARARCREVASIPGYHLPQHDWAAEAGSNRWLRAFGPEIALSALTPGEVTGKQCKKFFGDDYFPMLEQVVAANNMDDLGDFLFLLDICSGSLPLTPGSRYSVYGMDTKAAEWSPTYDVPDRVQDLERMLLINTVFQAATLTGGTIGGGYYPLSPEHVGRVQLRLLELRRGTKSLPASNRSPPAKK